LVPDFTLNILEGCGHSILMEVPDHLQAVLAWWFAGRNGPAPVYQPPARDLLAAHPLAELVAG
jgi:hypothetical protein